MGMFASVENRTPSDAEDPRLNRSGFLSTATSLSALAVTPVRADAQPGTPPATMLPVTGAPVPALAEFDRFTREFVQRWKIPGGQCAVAKDGAIVYSRGFGFVDAVRDGKPRPAAVEPSHVFRIASSSKPITAVAVMKLVQRGDLKLDQRAFDILSDLTPHSGAAPDPRLATIALRNLLDHSSGFVNDPFDPQFDGLRVAADLFSHPRPASSVDLIRYMMGRPLGFAPGTSYAYSNAGYNVLGRIIERVTKRSYGAAVQELVLSPLGITGLKLMTRTTPSARLPNEVSYFDGPNFLDSYSVYDDDPNVRQYADGGFDGSAIDAHGGWIASAADLVRFLNGVGGKTGPQILEPATVETMLARPNNPFYASRQKYYALGWDVDPGSVVMAHNGAITFGTLSSIMRLPGGVTVAAVFNHLDPDIAGILSDVVNGLRAVAKGVTTWPTHAA
jgi:CubicO group peptidase (beta-lactamase class C family)